MAVVESAERVELGVPLAIDVRFSRVVDRQKNAEATDGPGSDGVAGSEGGGGRLMSVGVAIFLLCLCALMLGWPRSWSCC